MYLGKTYFSLKYGTCSTKELVKQAVDAGATSLVLTNINATCDAWDFVQYCREEGIKPILGAEIRNGNALLYILLAANNRGFRWINAFLSDHLLEKKDFPEKPAEVFFEQPGDGFVIYPLGLRVPEELRENERIGVLPEEAGKLLRVPLGGAAAGRDTATGVASATARGKWVIRQPVTFQNKVYFNLHRLLRAVDCNILLTKLKPEDLAGQREYFVPQAEIMAAAFIMWAGAAEPTQLLPTVFASPMSIRSSWT